jgi:excisionase family DNA binding protein
MAIMETTAEAVAKPEPPSGCLITKRRTGEKLGVGDTTVYELTRRGVLHAIHVGRSLRYFEPEVDSVMVQMAAAAGVPAEVLATVERATDSMAS